MVVRDSGRGKGQDWTRVIRGIVVGVRVLQTRDSGIRDLLGQGQAFLAGCSRPWSRALHVRGVVTTLSPQCIPAVHVIQLRVESAHLGEVAAELQCFRGLLSLASPRGKTSTTLVSLIALGNKLSGQESVNGLPLHCRNFAARVRVLWLQRN